MTISVTIKVITGVVRSLAQGPSRGFGCVGRCCGATKHEVATKPRQMTDAMQAEELFQFPVFVCNCIALLQRVVVGYFGAYKLFLELLVDM